MESKTQHQHISLSIDSTYKLTAPTIVRVFSLSCNTYLSTYLPGVRLSAKNAFRSGTPKNVARGVAPPTLHAPRRPETTITTSALVVSKRAERRGRRHLATTERGSFSSTLQSNRPLPRGFDGPPEERLDPRVDRWGRRRPLRARGSSPGRARRQAPSPAPLERERSRTIAVTRRPE